MVFACSLSLMWRWPRYWLPFLLTRKENGGSSSLFASGWLPLRFLLRTRSKAGEPLALVLGVACWELRSASGPGRGLGVLRRLGVSSWTRSDAALVPLISLANSDAESATNFTAPTWTHGAFAIPLDCVLSRWNC